MQTPKISVIVPVYKVEPYLRKCLDSIVGQTYQNLEIILVDDGSPDKCGEICDEYARRDERIQVIHQDNGGVSAARNAGLKKVTGEWIGWIDPDDWAEPDMFEYLLKNALEMEADIAVCSHFQEFPNRSVFHGYTETMVLNRESGLELLLQNSLMQNYLWDKLWKAKLFYEICFPVGYTFEDMAIMHRLFIQAQRVICLPKAEYHYLQRAGSIVSDSSLDNRINHYRSSKNRLDEMQKDWPQFVPLLEAQCVASASSVWTAYYGNPAEKQKQYREQIKEIAAFSKKHCQNALKVTRAGRAGRIIMRLTPYANPLAFAIAYMGSQLYKLKKGRNL